MTVEQKSSLLAYARNKAVHGGHQRANWRACTGTSGADEQSMPGAKPYQSPAASSSAWRWRATPASAPKLLLLDEPLGALDKKRQQTSWSAGEHDRNGRHLHLMVTPAGKAMTTPAGGHHVGRPSCCKWPASEIYEQPNCRFRFIGGNQSVQRPGGGRNRYMCQIDSAELRRPIMSTTACRHWACRCGSSLRLGGPQ